MRLAWLTTVVSPSCNIPCFCGVSVPTPSQAGPQSRPLGGRGKWTPVRCEPCPAVRKGDLPQPRGLREGFLEGQGQSSGFLGHEGIWTLP